jgi:hypothetical protein
MRGWDVKSEALFSYVNCEARVPKDHPLRPIRRIVDEALGALSAEFEQLYAKFGRPSIPPERLLRALLLQAFYSVCDELAMVSIFLSVTLIIPTTNDRGSQIRGTGAAIAFHARRHNQLVGAVRIIEQRFWRHVLPGCRLPSSPAEVTVRKFFY